MKRPASMSALLDELELSINVSDEKLTVEHGRGMAKRLRALADKVELSLQGDATARPSPVPLPPTTNARRKITKDQLRQAASDMAIICMYLCLVAGVGIGVWQLVELGIRESDDYQRCLQIEAAAAANSSSSNATSDDNGCQEETIAIMVAAIIGVVLGIPCFLAMACVCLSGPAGKARSR